MTQYLLVVAFIVGLFAGAAPVRMYYEFKEDQRAKVEAEAALEQEKKNVAIVTQYQDLLSGVSDWYRRNPVRVRIQGSKNCAGDSSTTLSDVILTLPGYKGSDGSTTVR